MTPLATLLTAQLFQTSWARISSMVGIRIGSILVTLSLEPEEPAAGSALESLDIFQRYIAEQNPTGGKRVVKDKALAIRAPWRER